MKREIVCVICAEELNKLPHHPNEFKKLIMGMAKMDFICDQCNSDIKANRACFAFSLWTNDRNPYYEWEYNYINIPKIGCNLEQLERGTQIAYVPLHASDDLSHPDVEFGFITSINDRFAFCRYWSKHQENELRTKANSEGTPPARLVIIDSKPQELVNKMLKKYCK